jgi:AcrR family transcriptional regulator
MNKPSSKLENSRQHGKHQVDEQRDRILDAAKKLFLQNGIEKTRMIDIAAQAGIVKMSLYRYYPNRDVIALEIQERAMTKIVSLLTPEPQGTLMEIIKNLVRAMIRRFPELRDDYRLMGMFDQIYMDNTADAPLTKWAKTQLTPFVGKGFGAGEAMPAYNPQFNRMVMLGNAVIWFLEKLALRGEMTWGDQSIPLEDYLKLYEEMVVGYIDRYTETQ